MDPQACLDRAAEHLADAEPEDAIELLAYYATWRSRGGYQPAGGDRRASTLSRHARLALAGATLPVAATALAAPPKRTRRAPSTTIRTALAAAARKGGAK